jgi:hypothetical protein
MGRNFVWDFDFVPGLFRTCGREQPQCSRKLRGM